MFFLCDTNYCNVHVSNVSNCIVSNLSKYIASSVYAAVKEKKKKTKLLRNDGEKTTALFY